MSIAAFGASALSPVAALAQWSDLGLSGREVTQLRSRAGLLYACTNDGLHRKVSDTADSSWVLLGFAGQRVQDVLAVSPETLIVAREITGTGADTVAMLRTTDGGANWSPFQNGFGADGTSWHRRVVALLALSGAPGSMLAASWSRVGKSTDGGQTWKKVTVQARFTFLTAGNSALWAGGESSVMTPFLKRSTNGGESWGTAFFSGTDDVAFTMAFDPSDTNVAFLGLSNSIYRTADNGVSWAPVPLAPGVGSTSLGNRTFPPLRLYANGFVASGGATFYRTDDVGASWTPVTFAGAGSSSVWTILVRSGPSADTLFLGTGSGVLRYVDLELVGVGLLPKESRLKLLADPNPFPEGTTITFSLPRAAQVSLRVLDSAGRVVATLLNGELAGGPHRVDWPARGIPSGAYFCQLRAGSEVATRKLIIVR